MKNPFSADAPKHIQETAKTIAAFAALLTIVIVAALFPKVLLSCIILAILILIAVPVASVLRYIISK